MAKLILIRHGQSLWNAKHLWTGLTDISLSQTGSEEARSAAEKIKEEKIDVAFVSSLKRAKETLSVVLKATGQNYIKIVENKALDERDYGIYTGENKWELQKKFGEEKFFNIRRGWNVPIPNGETLKDVYSRVIPYYLENVLPELKNSKTVLISAHGNSLRALVKYLDRLSDAEVSKVEIPTGGVIVYEISEDGEVINKIIKHE